ncbi:MAG TPA: response regulator, partial [Phycisphaerales bacterium]|nr:response regulator [Phycisphaerales bacterium]
MEAHGVTTQHLPRLLAIDDSPLIHRLLKAKLKAERLEIHCTTSGEQGLQAARVLSPDLILLDINLPDMDGIAALQQL